MKLTVPTILTLLRIALVPVLVLVFYLPFSWSNVACMIIFVLAAITDIADGAIARRTGQMSRFGAFLDPVADKIMVTTALVLLVQRQETYQAIFAIAAAVIIGREITISALREWMAEIGERALVNVSWIGKTKTGFQMTAIGFLLYHEDLSPWANLLLLAPVAFVTGSFFPALFEAAAENPLGVFAADSIGAAIGSMASFFIPIVFGFNWFFVFATAMFWVTALVTFIFFRNLRAAPVAKAAV